MMLIAQMEGRGGAAGPLDVVGSQPRTLASGHRSRTGSRRRTTSSTHHLCPFPPNTITRAHVVKHTHTPLAGPCQVKDKAALLDYVRRVTGERPVAVGEITDAYGGAAQDIEVRRGSGLRWCAVGVGVGGMLPMRSAVRCRPSNVGEARGVGVR